MTHEALAPTSPAIVPDRLATGWEASERLLSIDDLPAALVQQARRRMVQCAPPLAELAPDARAQRLILPLPADWSLVTPSVALAPGGYRLIVQSVTGETGPHRNSNGKAHAPNGKVRTRNHWVELTPDLAVGRVEAIQDLTAGSKAVVRQASAFADGRLIPRGDGWWVLGTVRERGGAQERRALLRLDGPRVIESRVLETCPAASEDPWVPVLAAGGDSLAFLTSVAPTTVLGYDETTGDLAPLASRPAPLVARDLQPATPAIPCDGGRLCLLRDTVEGEDGARTVHRWVWFDAEWTLARLSRPFVFMDPSGECAAGLAARNGDLVVSVGIDRREVWLVTVPRAQVMALLAPPLALDLAALEPALDGDFALPEPEPAPVTIVSMTISGGNREIVGDALRSVVDWVDWCLLVDTGITDDTIEIARAIAGDKLIVRHFPWCDNFSAARNFALAAAAETGATWAVTIDTDERMELSGVDIRAALAATAEPALLAPHSSGEYTKDRFFRLPAAGEFRWATHEAYYRTDTFGGATVGIPGVYFIELLKTPDEFRHKFERDRRILEWETRLHPEEQRVFFYLGDALQRLHRYEEAVEAFRACAALRSWDEEAAWAMYRAAECLINLGRLEDALEACATGMTRHAGLADIPWLAAYLSLQLDRPEQAVYWARQSIVMGYFAGCGATVLRTGWRYPFGLWEGPYDVLRFALRRLGDDAGADEAERLFHEAAAARRAQPANT
jgi:tetratricopeptide (TPR) repeat protein